ncbi:hypothetical protein ABL78_3655 [Leptomonas seymouri]|uniref:Uncharacterized protein n=1 Tax=Leptomonas seymouri TaxID=5684 RepID=A0A0N1I5U7_LEPSE|nr:hypothetical protein ABL78_3655 [Leptomonas seymouri]|eukprot:KPI87260.1 hypothetical protein ABL78_3655 [Leptomonas seymouri]
MTESEDENLTILSAWAPKAYHCFDAEFKELEQLKKRHEVTDSEARQELEARCRAEVDLQIQRDYPEVYPILSNVLPTTRSATAPPPSGSPVSGSSGGGSFVKRQKVRQAQQQLQAEVAMVTAKRETLLQQRIEAALAARDRQPARQLAARYSNQLATTEKHVKAYLEKEAYELQRFTSRPLASYALGEVLDLPPAPIKAATLPAVLVTSSPPSPFKRAGASSSEKRDGTAGASSMSHAVSERGSNRSFRTRASAGRHTPRSGKVGGAGTLLRTQSSSGRRLEGAAAAGDKGDHDTTLAAALPPFLIDAHQFAVEYNEMLKKEYGYRPAMTNAFPTTEDSGKAMLAYSGVKKEAHEAAGAAASARSVIDNAGLSLQEKLRTHVPGETNKRVVQDGSAAGEGSNGGGWLPPVHAAAQQGFTADGTLLSSASQTPAPKASSAGGGEAKGRPFAHSSSSGPWRPEKSASATSSHHHQTQRVGNAGAPSKPTVSKTATKACGFSSPSTSILSGIECSAKGKGLRFSAYMGEPIRQVVRFVNRNAHRTRLRLKAAAHPWFSYRCTRIAPAAGGVDAATADAVPPEAPLNCGGFVEVEVVFCPQSIEASTAVLEAVLEMGVARELNDRHSEGAQWQFMRIPVHGEVVLPHFDWWRVIYTEGKEKAMWGDVVADTLAPSDEGAQSAASAESLESGRLIAHADIVSCAAPLHLNNGAALEFGDALVLGRVWQSLLLENTGSEAVVHILSSSPEFSISVAPETATTLPPLQAVVLQVAFCPLKEGLCEATLTVAVRASSDPASTILSEHTVELHGIGVVPRVSIASLAAQVVRESGLPQWQVSKSEAPLHTILKDTMPGVPAEVAVTVRNECAVPLAFHWEGNSDVPRSVDSSVEPAGVDKADSPVSAAVVGAGAGMKVAILAARSFISVPSGVLPPFSTSSFVLTITPATLQPLQTLYNLFLDGMPDPAAAENTEKLPYVDAEVVDFYRRNRLIPCTAPQQHEGEAVPSTGGNVNEAEGEESLQHFDALHVTYLDPITAFSRFQLSTAESKVRTAEMRPSRGVFATSFLTYQQPSLPSLTVTPAVIEERVECLLKCRHTRTVTLQNNAPVALHFVLDPTEAEFTASLQKPPFRSNLYGPSDAAPLLTPSTSTFERWRGYFPACDGISAQCQPRKGVIPPHGTITVTVHFTVEACGPHYAVVPCWVPEAEQLRSLLATAGSAVRAASETRQPCLLAREGSSRSRYQQQGSAGPLPANGRRPVSPSAPLLTSEDPLLGNHRSSERRPFAGLGPDGVDNTITTVSRIPVGEALRIIEDGGCYAISVTATGVGATVKASTDLLDFGLIELGQEAAASFTVSNPNSIPVVFDLCDPLMRHPPRFVFIPESFRLGAGNTVEVTVYRKAVSTEDAQTFFELTVRDGGASIAVETRATIQQPLLVVDEPVVQFGVVPEGVWQTGTFYVSNRSAIDTKFTVAPATPLPPYIEIEYEQDFVLRAGERLGVPVRCRFQAITAPLPSAASVGSTRKDAQAADDCYSTLLRLVSKRNWQTLLVEVRCDTVEKLSVSVDVVEDGVQDGAAPPHMPIAAYIRAVLMNSLEAALLTICRSEMQSTNAATAAVTATLPSTVAAATTIIPYCNPAHLVDYMPDDLPLSRRSVDLVMQSYTGGEAMFTVEAQRYAPQPMESIGAQRMLAKKRATVQAAANTSNHNEKKACEVAFASSTLAGVSAEDETPVSPPAFWASTVNGGATAQRALRQLMEAAQKVLGDGSGCATLLSSIAGVLQSHGTVRIPVQLWCALPGRYVEHLCLQADPTLPLLRLPVEYEVYGKPIVLDGTTSGLTKDGGRKGEDVLLMPPVIAPLGSSRRTIRLINRVSRDMDLTVDIFPCPLGLAVAAVDPDVPADKVELKLNTMTAEDKEKERNRIGCVTATPFKLCIPAHTRREVLLEFTPSAGLSEDDATDDGDAKRQLGRGGAKESAAASTVSHRHGSSGNDSGENNSDGDEEAMLPPSEKWWQGSVCINAVLAQTDTNDAFLIDEFYTIYADRYPSQRMARPLSGASAGSEPSNSGGFSATQVKVLQPLRTRPNDRVVRRSRIVWPTEAEQRVLDRYAATQAAATSVPLPEWAAKAAGAAAGGGVMASNDDDDGAKLIDTPEFTRSPLSHKGVDKTSTALPPLDVLLREAEERRALLDFISTRRQDLQEEGNRYFSSIELRLRARCGRPHLTIEPSERCVEFPAVPHVEEKITEPASKSSSAPRCTRTVRLTNRNSAQLRFALSSVSPTREATSMLSPPDELFTIVRCVLLRSGRDKAQEVFSLTNGATQVDASDEESKLGSDEAHVYALDSMDALDVTIDAETRSAAWHQYLSQQLQQQRSLPHDTQATKEAVEGMLKVQFLPTSTVSTANNQKIPAQLLPLRVPLTKPSIECRPGVIWFRPGQQRHDGRPQVAYAQTFTLYNTGAASARFQIHPVAGNPADALREEAIRTFRLQQQQLLQRSQMSASASSAVMGGLVAANTVTTEVGVMGTDAHHSLMHKVKEVVRMPSSPPPAEGRADLVYVDEPMQFSISPLEGVLPAASRGGEPGEVKVAVSFREFSSVRYESLFAVVVVGDPSVSPAYILVRGDSRDTEL